VGGARQSTRAHGTQRTHDSHALTVNKTIYTNTRPGMSRNVSVTKPRITRIPVTEP